MVADRSIVRSLPAICQFGRYELLGRIAVGGMAEIYLARERENIQGAGHRHLVIKRVLSHVAGDPKFQEMFFDEARLAMRLQHPAIVHIYEFGEEAGSTFLAMEWVDGVALGKLIRRGREVGGIPAPIAVKVAATIAEALHYAHRVRGDNNEPLSIVHRDVSPQNIMLSYEGSVKLLDFGIAKATDQMSRTSDGQVKGKFAYMAPEQCVGDPVDARADIFALGVCLYESLTGRPLYHRKTQYETMRAVLEDDPPSIQRYRPELPDDLEAIVQKALAKNRDDRFETAEAMQIALEQWLGRAQEIITAPRIADFVAKVFEGDSVRGPQVDSTPFGQSFQGSIPSMPIPGGGPPPSPPRPGSNSPTSRPPSSGTPSNVPNMKMASALPSGLGGLSGLEDLSSLDDAGETAVESPASSRPPAGAVPVEVLMPETGEVVYQSAPEDSKPQRKWPWFLLVLLLLGSGIGGALWWQGQPLAVATQTPSSTPVPIPVVQPQPQPQPQIPGDPVESGEGIAGHMPSDSVPSGSVPPNAEADPGSAETRYARLRVESVPVGAEVRVNGESLGFTPVFLEAMRPGGADIEVDLEGHALWQAHVTLREGETLALSPALRLSRRHSGRGMSMRRQSMDSAGEASPMDETPASRAELGSISVNTRPWSKIYIGNRLLGTTPLGRAPLPAGAVRVRFVDRDGNTHHRSLSIAPGEDTRAFFDFSETD